MPLMHCRSKSNARSCSWRKLWLSRRSMKANLRAEEVYDGGGNRALFRTGPSHARPLVIAILAVVGRLSRQVATRQRGQPTRRWHPRPLQNGASSHDTGGKRSDPVSLTPDHQPVAVV